MYDGETISLYIDGRLVNRQHAGGQLVHAPELAVGRLPGGAGKFNGAIHEVRVSDVARSEAWLAASYANLADPDFVQVIE